MDTKSGLSNSLESILIRTNELPIAVSCPFIIYQCRVSVVRLEKITLDEPRLSFCRIVEDH